MRVFWILFAVGCGASEDYSLPPDNGGGASTDGGFVGCRSSNECPAGTVCNDFGRCEAPPSGSDAGTPPPPEVEYDFGPPISSQRYVYVAMTAQDELARIDGQTLEVKSTKVGDSPRVV